MLSGTQNTPSGGKGDASLAFIFPTRGEFCLQLYPVRLGYLHATRTADGGVTGDVKRSC